ncbi:S8 family peptidase [Kribbella sp. NPDC051586]|uniref:S8 family peptidase n=1 Tax=Kribbella sp. NPDC051586 TaxID=3364118 RepID=UPI00379BB691
MAASITGPAAAAGPAAPAIPRKGGKDVSVTLITGDRVLWPGGDPSRATIEPGAGRRQVGFKTYRLKGHSYVFPADSIKAVADGRLDRRLFDVTELVEDGYDDASTSSIPVLTTYAGTAKRAVPAEASITRQLPSISGAAMKVSKKNTSSFLASGSFAKVWLDGRRHLTLDQSVPQIGGPVAWQAGYTGKGVPVAVLDSGIDATHPDLATQVVGEKNFTTESAEDLVGHGTHVASTIAGTGAASDGRYKGVAPDARIYDGKVCEVWGCDESAILAGMEWATTEVKAKIVNLSLGGTDTPELDPLEEAVNRLTAQTGTLFVIAAGNEGPGDGTIGSPGSADAALTVGNVTKQDQLNELSSRGPRIGDSAVKPDVTAPGTDIVAAKSKDSSIGEPVGDKYLRLSGTSMATPHTAGAAAILLQEHPSWTPAELKAALMGSAKVDADLTAFQQGAGRIDLTTAIKASVVAEPGSVSFGKASYPHSDDEPVTRPVTFRNLGDVDVTLALSSVLTGPDGAAAPSGALKLSADSVVVPAGGTASVQATSDTSVGGADGLYSGRITATGGGQTVVVPVGVEREGETYTLTVKPIRADGSPDSADPVLVVGVDNDEFAHYAPDVSGTVSVRLPKGEYLLEDHQVVEPGSGERTNYELVAPSVQLATDQTVVLDARKAKVVTTTVPQAGAQQASEDVGYDRILASGDFSSSDVGFQFGHLYTYSTGPKLPASRLIGHVTSQWGDPGADGSFTNTPYLYGIANYQPGEFVTGFDRAVKQSDLAAVDSTVNATDGGRVSKLIYPLTQAGVETGFAALIQLDTPRTIRYYLDQSPGGWSGDLLSPDWTWTMSGDPVSYQAGRQYQERWNAAVFAPSLSLVVRTPTELGILLSNRTDGDGHGGSVPAKSASTTLYRDGTEVGSWARFGSVDATGLPTGSASYRLVTTGTQDLLPFSTRIDLDATFTSSADQPSVAIHTVAFQPDVDANNLMVRKPVTVLPFKVEGAKQVKIQYSDDGGVTWKQAPVAGDKAIFPTPAGDTISLRSTATDAAGNSTTQTVIAAYRMR